MLIALFLTAALGGQDTGPGDFTWGEAVPAGTTIEIRGIIGSITASGTSGREVQVTGRRRRGSEGDPAAVEVRVLREGSRIVFCTIYPRNEQWNREDPEKERDACRAAQREGPRMRGSNDTRIDYDVRVPAGIHFVGQTVTEEVNVGGIRGNAEGYSVAGAVRIRNVRGSLVDAASISGDITLEEIDAAMAYAGTLSGSVRFSGTMHPAGDYSFHTYTGDLDVVLPRRIGVSLLVYAQRRKLSSPVALEPISTASGKRFRGRRGDGSARLSLTSFNGEVTVREAE